MELGSTQPESNSEDEDMGGDDDDEEEGKDEGESTAVKDSAASPSSSSNPGLNLAGFLFGNIDDEGKLSDDHSFLDSDTRAKLGGLSQLLGAADSEILKVRLTSDLPLSTLSLIKYVLHYFNLRTKTTKARRLPPRRARQKLRTMTRRRRRRRPRTFPASKRRSARRTRTPQTPRRTTTAATARKVGHTFRHIYLRQLT